MEQSVNLILNLNIRPPPLHNIIIPFHHMYHRRRSLLLFTSPAIVFNSYLFVDQMAKQSVIAA